MTRSRFSCSLGTSAQLAPGTLGGSLPDALDLGGGVGVDDAPGMHLDALPARLHPLPLLPVVPVDLGGILQIWQLPGLHARRQVLGRDIVELLVQLVFNHLAHCRKVLISIRHLSQSFTESRSAKLCLVGLSLARGT